MASEFKTCDDIFQCTQCGECCQGFGGTYVSDKDIIRISRFLNCDPAKFAETYCDPSGSKLVLTQSEDGKCIFFKKNCSIHPVKPLMCRAWPFLETIIKNPENWDAMAGSCPGIKKGVPHQDLIPIVSREIQRLKAYKS